VKRTGEEMQFGKTEGKPRENWGRGVVAGKL